MSVHPCSFYYNFKNAIYICASLQFYTTLILFHYHEEIQLQTIATIPLIFTS